MSSSELVRRRRGIGGRVAFCVCGPSGAGKTSVIKAVMADLPGLAFSVSYTTRPKRAGETDGVDYCHIARDAFEQLISNGDLVEHVTYSGHLYGTSRRQIETVLERGDDLVLNVDVEGARTLKRCGLAADCDVVYVFLMPSSLERLGERLRRRGSEDEARIATRLAVAAREIKELSWFDYLVVNDAFDVAVDELRSIIVAERARIRGHDARD